MLNYQNIQLFYLRNIIKRLPDNLNVYQIMVFTIRCLPDLHLILLIKCLPNIRLKLINLLKIRDSQAHKGQARQPQLLILHGTSTEILKRIFCLKRLNVKLSEYLVILFTKYNYSKNIVPGTNEFLLRPRSVCVPSAFRPLGPHYCPAASVLNSP